MYTAVNSILNCNRIEHVQIRQLRGEGMQSKKKL